MSIVLRPVKAADINLIRSWFLHDSEGNKRLGFYSEPQKWLSLVGKDRYGWIICVGNAGVGFVDMEHAGEAGHIAYYIAPEHRGKGLMALVLQEIAKHAKTLHITTLQGGFEADNISSRKVLEKAGYKLSNVDRNGMITGNLTIH